MKKNIKIKKKETLYNGFFKLHKFTFKHKKHNGTWSKLLNREVFGGAQVASVLPYDPVTNKIILIDQFRIGLIESNQNIIMKEIVAGYIDENETPEEAAIRECKEETGCTAINLKKIISYFPAPGSSQSYYHIFLAEVNSFKGKRIVGNLNEDEDILVRSYTLNEVKKLLNKGRIINGITIIAIQWFFLNYKKI